MLLHEEKHFALTFFLLSNTSSRLREFAKMFFKRREKDEKGIHILNENSRKKVYIDREKRGTRERFKRMKIMCIYLFSIMCNNRV